MPIEFPNLSDSPLCGMVACASVCTDQAEQKKWLAEQRQKIAIFKRGTVAHFVRFTTGGQKKNHFHVEVARKEMFPADRQPKALNKLSEIVGDIEEMMSQKLHLSLNGNFIVPYDNLPRTGPIRLLSEQADVAGTSIKLVSGVFEVSGSRIKNVGWERKESVVHISLRATLSQVVSETYLLEGQVMLERFFKVLILNQAPLAS
ncbi:hypothetical protein [Luteolibacter sp. Populi]|uniref:hypothetical protein n=1 Tax=Luteolibacter sp. Populi TaxID=3230487 RepID=UPI003467234A